MARRHNLHSSLLFRWRRSALAATGAATVPPSLIPLALPGPANPPSAAPAAGTIEIELAGGHRLWTEDLSMRPRCGGMIAALTVESMEALVADGKILRWGVSNFDTHNMRELIAADGERCQTDQILYNFMTRGPEHDLLPFLSARRMPTIAYGPVAQGRLPANHGLAAFASERNATPAQVALARLLSRKDVIGIPKTRSAARVRENRAALDFALSDADLQRLDRLFQAPSGPEPLRMQ